MSNLDNTPQKIKEIIFIKKEFQEQKALCLFKLIYSKDEMFNIADYVMTETAKMFKEELIQDTTNIEDINTTIDLIRALFAVTDKAINGDTKAKQIGSILAEVIEVNEIPHNVRKFVMTELMLNSEKS